MVSEPVRDRLRSLEGRELLGLLLVVVLVLGGIAFWYLRSLPSPVRIDAALGGGGVSDASGGPATASPEPSAGPVVVYVSGWVRHPGVYEFRSGDRIVDAIDRAGGAKNGADLTSLNLAALLADGEQIVVGKAGAAHGLPSGTSTGSNPSDAGDPGGLVNINTATLEELETLSGIGPALGQRIIDYREEHGPFQAVDELMNVSGIGEKRLADLRPHVTV
jgi:competence protein ComEA